jgi:hypothetical protein
MFSCAMVAKWISLVAFGLALSACSGVSLHGPERRYTGVWLYEFESSDFLEGETRVPKARPSERNTDWLEFPSGQLGLDRAPTNNGYDEKLGCYPVQPFLVTFIGQRTRRPFGAGHMGLWRSQMTVRRTISIERLGSAFCYPA